MIDPTHLSSDHVFPPLHNRKTGSHWAAGSPTVLLPVTPAADAPQRVARHSAGEGPTEKGIVSIPLAIGTLDNIVTLRQPRGYTSLWAGMFGTLLGPDYANKDVKERGSARTFAFTALLPEMRPWTKDTLPEFKKPGGGDVVSGTVTSVLGAKSTPTEDVYLRIQFGIERDGLLHDAQVRPSGVTVGANPLG